MSFTENDRNLRSKKGKSFHDGGGYDGAAFVTAIAEALRAEFGAAPASLKRIARLTRSNERAVRNWIEGKNGPSGANLVALIQHSDAVFEMVLALSHRKHLTAAIHLTELRAHLLIAVAAIDAVEQRQS
jgi:hypothetical protein